MVLGLRSKNRKGGIVQVEYLLHAREIKPWPPSQHLASVQSVLIQWENSDKATGFFTSNAVDGKVEFGEIFRLPVTLSRETSKKSNGGNLFQKNYLEFNLYEQRKDKTTKGQLLGSTVINLAEYGIIQDVITISAPISFKKSSKGSAKSVLYVSVRPFDVDKSSLSKELSLEGSESVSEITNEGIDEETEIASFADDEDAVSEISSSNSSRNICTSALESDKVASHQYEVHESHHAKTGMGKAKEESAAHLDAVASISVTQSEPAAIKHQNGTLHPPSVTNLSSGLQNPAHEHMPQVVPSDDRIQENAKMNYVDHLESQTSKEAIGKYRRHDKNGPQGSPGSLHDDHEKSELQDHGSNGEISEAKRHVFEENLNVKLPQDARTNEAKLRSNIVANNRTATAMQGNTRKDMLKNLKSVQSQFHSSENDECFIDGHFMEKPRKTDTAKNVHRVPKSDAPSERKHKVESLADSKVKLKSKIEMLEEGISEVAKVKVESHSTVDNHEFTHKTKEMKKNKENDLQENAHENGGNYLSSERQGEAFNHSGENAELKTKVEMLEEELMETAALEIGLYSVVAEHGSSTNKVHASARRLARFYLHACKENSPSQGASAARAIISGLVLVSKACGNDVPRLSFWLSNTIMLRVIVSQAINDSASPKDQRTHKTKDSDEWEDPQTYVVALEKVEAWIFSRIVESIWWQTLTPHMQSTAVKGSTHRKTQAKKYGLGDAEQGNFAVDLWKKAFKDACERLCPNRAGGHECGCLPVMARLVMEQLVDRLDVAMFNAILRESAEEMPTDPVSDPISDPKVLPIPAGKSSFGAGAQLKNAVGNWSRWLTDLFGIDDNDSPGENDENDSNSAKSQTSFKAFQLLIALSDLMMLPFEMLADSSTRKEICPTFDAPLIKRVLHNFVPDEFNPDPIPEPIFEALESEDNANVGHDSLSSFPLTAAPATYSPPSAASLVNIIGDVGTQPLQRSGSTVTKKSYTSDDELDELDSPIASIIPENSRNSPISTPSWMQKGKGGRKVVRYQLLRQVWKKGE